MGQSEDEWANESQQIAQQSLLLLKQLPQWQFSVGFGLLANESHKKVLNGRMRLSLSLPLPPSLSVSLSFCALWLFSHIKPKIEDISQKKDTDCNSTRHVFPNGLTSPLSPFLSPSHPTHTCCIYGACIGNIYQFPAATYAICWCSSSSSGCHLTHICPTSGSSCFTRNDLRPLWLNLFCL